MAGTNGIDSTVANRWLGEILRVYDDLETQKIDNMNRCRTIRGRLPDLYGGAQAAGLPLRAFKLAVKQRLIERKIEGLEEDIGDLKPDDADDAAAFEMLQAALGGFADTPLGAATLEQAADRRDKAATRKAKVAKTEPAADDQAAKNTAALEGGIKPLDDREFDDATSSKPSRRQSRSAKLDDLDSTKH